LFGTKGENQTPRISGATCIADAVALTRVIFTSDNGPWLCYANCADSAKALRNGEITDWEVVVGEPCMMHWPGHILTCADTWDVLITIDLLSTIAKIVGVELPKYLTVAACGRSFRAARSNNQHQSDLL
jgi:arylsulfatase A-like enzyme